MKIKTIFLISLFLIGTISCTNKKNISLGDYYILGDLTDNNGFLFNKMTSEKLFKLLDNDARNLSNKDSAIYLAKNIGDNTEKIMLMHLSHKNNTEDKALETIREIFNEYEISFDNITCAKQKEKSELMIL